MDSWVAPKAPEPDRRPNNWRRFCWALGVSLALHAWVACPRAPGDVAGTGSLPGKEKPGARAVEIGIVEAPVQPRPRVVPPPRPTPAKPPEPEKPKPAVEPPPRTGVAVRAPPPKRASPPRPAPKPAPKPTPAAEPPAVQDVPLAGSEHMATGTDVGGASSVRAQRGRLPPKVVCNDPIEGIWVSNQFAPWLGGWYLFTLTIHRNGDVLVGEIQSNFWMGDSTDTTPPLCMAGEEHGIVRMSARGEARGLQLTFGGVAISSFRILCGHMVGYALDSFTGVIDPDLQEFESLNNDGEAAIDVPTLFRRVRCVDAFNL